MTKTATFSKILKLTVRLLAFSVRTAAVIIPKLIKELFGTINKRLRFSITFKTSVTYALTFAAIFFMISMGIMSAFTGLLLYEARNDLEKNAGAASELLAQSISYSAADSATDSTIDSEIDAETMKRIKSYARIEGITVSLLNRHGTVEYSSGEYTAGEEVSLPDRILSHKGLYLVGQNIYVKIEVPNHADVRHIVVHRSLQKEIIYLVALAAGLAISFLLAEFFTVFRGAKTLRRMLQPINDMINTTRLISAGDLQTRLNVVDSHDELKDLAETFNEMLDRIEISYEQRNRFVSDASHELRTPISVIQGYANLLQRWGKEDKEVLTESITAIKNESDNMKELVERLLFLARADKDTQKVEKTLFSVNELIEELVKETRLVAAEHEITGQAGPHITLKADRSLMKQALRIFIDNSIKYTPQGGVIKISSCQDDCRIKVCVEDNGIGISSEDMPNVFERFYKCDKSRTRESGGTGLGLSIAKWIIEKHEGIVNIESVPGLGTKVTVELPDR